MKRFAFKLEPLLRLRRNELEQEQNRLGEAAGLCNRLRGDIDRNESEKRRIWREEGAAERNFFAMEQDFLYISRLNQSNDSLSLELKHGEEKVSTIRRDYLQALTRVRTLEKLRQRHYADYKRERKRYETRFFDEASSLLFTDN